MSRRRKYTIETKIKACEDYLNGIRSPSQICQDLGLGKCQYMTLYRWVDKYKVYGASAFEQLTRSYSKEFKTKVVEEYLNGLHSARELTVKYNISGVAMVHRWILKYNSNIELKDYDPRPEVYMASARRKTTIEEREEIVNYCITHNRDYKGTAEQFEVSYSQVHAWVKKFDAFGKEGLTDKRGRHKSDEEVDELEKLRRENARLKRQLMERDMTVELLKKVKEFERRRF